MKDTLRTVFFVFSYQCLNMSQSTFFTQPKKKIAISVIRSILALLIPLPLFSIILNYTDKHGPARLIHYFPLMDALPFIVCFFFYVLKIQIQ